MGPRQTISFFDKISNKVISIQVAGSSHIASGAGFWNTGTNQVLLGAERFDDWNA
jgi:hypothetical protein